MLKTGSVTTQYVKNLKQIGAKSAPMPNVSAVLHELAAACQGDEDVSAMPLYAGLVPGVILLNNGMLHSVLLTIQNRGARDRRQELLNKIAFGHTTPEQAEKVLNTETVALYDTQTGNIFYAVSETTKVDGKYSTKGGIGVCATEALLSERRRDFVDMAARQSEIADRHQPVYDLLTIALADRVLAENFSEGALSFSQAMAQAHDQMKTEAEAGGFEVDEMPDATYTFDLMDFAVFCADITMTSYSIAAQSGDLAQQGYDVSEYQNVYQNVFTAGAVVDLYNDIVFCVVEQPEDMVARCHGIVARAVNMRETINMLCETYDAVANAAEEAATSQKH